MGQAGAGGAVLDVPPACGATAAPNRCKSNSWPLVMMASLVPLTLSGLGTRDAAIIVLYSPFMPAATAAALGLLIILRYLVPAIAGIPFTSRYLGRVRLLGGG